MLLECIERETGPQPSWSILWLHGLGADGHDFVPIVPELLRRGWPALRFVFPHAPVRPVTINNGVPMRAWYDIVDIDLANRADESGVSQSVEQVEALVRSGDGPDTGFVSSDMIVARAQNDGLPHSLRRAVCRRWRIAALEPAWHDLFLMLRATPEHRIKSQPEKGGDHGKDDDLGNHLNNLLPN